MKPFDPYDSLVPVFLGTDLPKRFGQMGSAFFLDFHGEPFLLTATHVTDELKNGTLFVPTDDGPLPIEGYIASAEPPAAPPWAPTIAPATPPITAPSGPANIPARAPSSGRRQNSGCEYDGKCCEMLQRGCVRSHDESFKKYGWKKSWRQCRPRLNKKGI